jgi:hypothetical protein
LGGASPRAAVPGRRGALATAVRHHLEIVVLRPRDKRLHARRSTAERAPRVSCGAVASLERSPSRRWRAGGKPTNTSAKFLDRQRKLASDGPSTPQKLAGQRRGFRVLTRTTSSLPWQLVAPCLANRAYLTDDVAPVAACSTLFGQSGLSYGRRRSRGSL